MSTEKVANAGHGLKENTRSIAQFAQIAQKAEMTFHSLQFTRNMLHSIVDLEIKSAASLSAIVENKKKEKITFSHLDKGIQNYWRETARLRMEMAQQLQREVIEPVDAYLTTSREKIKNLVKLNAKTLKNFNTVSHDGQKFDAACMKDWQKLQSVLKNNPGANSKVKEVRVNQEKCNKSFSRLEVSMQQMNELEMENHEQSVDLVKVFYETVIQQSKRLLIHYKNAQQYMAWLTKWCAEFENFTKPDSIPSLNETVWKLVCFPTRHYPKLPCSSEQVKTCTDPNLKYAVDPTKDKTQLSRHLIAPKDNPSAQNNNDTTDNNENNRKLKKPKEKEKDKTDTKEKNTAIDEASPVNTKLVSAAAAVLNHAKEEKKTDGAGGGDDRWFGDDKWFSDDAGAPPKPSDDNDDDGWGATFEFDKNKEEKEPGWNDPFDPRSSALTPVADSVISGAPNDDPFGDEPRRFSITASTASQKQQVPPATVTETKTDDLFNDEPNTFGGDGLFTGIKAASNNTHVNDDKNQPADDLFPADKTDDGFGDTSVPNQKNSMGVDDDEFADNLDVEFPEFDTETNNKSGENETTGNGLSPNIQGFESKTQKTPNDEFFDSAGDDLFGNEKSGDIFNSANMFGDDEKGKEKEKEASSQKKEPVVNLDENNPFAMMGTDTVDGEDGINPFDDSLFGGPATTKPNTTATPADDDFFSNNDDPF